MAYQILRVEYENGGAEYVDVACGNSIGGRRLPTRIGESLIDGKARAWLEYDGRERSAVLHNGTYYMRVRDQH